MPQIYLPWFLCCIAFSTFPAQGETANEGSTYRIITPIRVVNVCVLDDEKGHVPREVIEDLILRLSYDYTVQVGIGFKVVEFHDH